jgi:hypothetical protein
MAFVYQECGEAGLRQLLDLLVSPTMPPELAEPLAAAYVDKWEPSTTEDLIATAGELAEMGLEAAGDIVAEIAASTPEPTCPHAAGTGNARDWLRRYSNAGGFIPEDQRWWLD